MRLNEFSSTPLTFKDVLGALTQHFGLERVGGPARVYTVGDQLGVAFVEHGKLSGVGLSWKRGSKAVSKVFFWNVFNAEHAPDLVIDIPEGATMTTIPLIIDFIANPHTGPVAAITEDVGPAANDDESEVLNEPVAPPEEAPVPVEAPIKVQIMARNASGELFEIPGMDRWSARIEKAMKSEAGDDTSSTMEEQYAQLRDKVELVAGNKSHHIKSLLIYGAPSSGKTFSVMQVVKSLGLKEGVDYVVKKGSITDFAAYRTLIQNIDGLVIFDDCDSVVATKVGKNMIKGALDTYAVRDLSYDNANTIDTDSMTTDDRVIFVDAMSRVMRGTASSADIDLFGRYAVSEKKDKRKVVVKDGEFEMPDIDELLADYDDQSSSGRLHELQDYFSRRLPNKIDYRGRMIFISNMGKDEWDSAILTRTFRQYMSFGDDEMLDFIDKIKGSIEAPNLSDEQKQEVIDWIRTLHDSGRLNTAVNFRLVQQGFDLRLTSGWKKAIASL